MTHIKLLLIRYRCESLFDIILKHFFDGTFLCHLHLQTIKLSYLKPILGHLLQKCVGQQLNCHDLLPSGDNSIFHSSNNRKHLMESDTVIDEKILSTTLPLNPFCVIVLHKTVLENIIFNQQCHEIVADLVYEDHALSPLFSICTSKSLWLFIIALYPHHHFTEDNILQQPETCIIAPIFNIVPDLISLGAYLWS